MEGKPPAHRGEPQRLSVRMGKADKEKERFGEMAGSCIFDSLTARSWKSTRKNNGNNELHFIIERPSFPWGGVKHHVKVIPPLEFLLFVSRCKRGGCLFTRQIRTRKA